MTHKKRFFSLFVTLCLFLTFSLAISAAEEIGNLAVGKTATAGSIHNESYPASYVTDGDKSTRWNSLGSMSENDWLKIDLEYESSISRIDFYWYAALNYANHMEISISSDDETYSVVKTIDGVAYVATQSVAFDTPITARYIKFTMNNCASKWGYSFNEVEIYGTSVGRNLALNKTAYGSSCYNENWKHDIEYSYLTDGDMKTRWSSLTYESLPAETPVEEWIFVDLEKVCDISQIKILWHSNVTYAKDMTVQVSGDGINFADVQNVSVSAYSAWQTVSFDNGVSGRYIKLAMHVPSKIYGYSIFEFQVYGIETEKLGTSLPNTEAEFGSYTGTVVLEDSDSASAGVYVTQFDHRDTVTFPCYDGANNVQIKYRSEYDGEFSIHIDGKLAATVKYPAFADEDKWGIISVDAYIPVGSRVTFKPSCDVSLDSVKWNAEAQNELSDTLFLAKDGELIGDGEIETVAGAIRKDAVSMTSGASLQFFKIPSGYKTVKLRYLADADASVTLSSEGQNEKTVTIPETQGIKTVYLALEGEFESYIKLTVHGDITVDYIELTERTVPETVVVSDDYTDKLHESISLNGYWECIAGEYEDEIPPIFFDNVIPVPGMWDLAEDSLGEDTGKSLWYQKTVFLDTVPDDYVVELVINKAYYGKTVYVNGEYIGSDPYNFTAYSFDITDALVAGENIIQIKVGTYKSGAEDPDNPAHMGYDPEKSSYLPGIVDSVNLEIHKTSSIKQVQTAPDLNAGTLRVVTQIENMADTDLTTDVVFKVYELGVYTDGSPASDTLIQIVTLTNQTVAAGQTLDIDNTIIIPDFNKKDKAWTPSNPYLYRLEVETVGDKQTHRFGMRTFTIDATTKQALLNGEVYYLRGTNVCINRFYEDQDRADHPWDEAWARTLFSQFKSANLESARFCIGFPPEFWYDICDEIGFLVVDEYPFWRCNNANLCDGCNADDLTVEVTRWIYERNNHPCVIWWDIQNESADSVDAKTTSTVISNVRNIDIQCRAWDNGWAPVQDSAYPAEQHLYPFRDTSFTLDDIGTDALVYYDRVSARPNVEQYPMYINEFGWLWVDREGNPTLLTKAGYGIENRGTNPEEYKEFYAIAVAQLAERYRQSRLYFGIMQFCGLSYSHPIGTGATSDILAPDLTMPEIRPEQKIRLRSAFAPVGIVIDDWTTRGFLNSTRVVPVSLINDLNEEVTKDVTVTLYKNHKESEWIEVASQTVVITAAPLEVTEAVEFEFDFPEVGSYTIVASYVVDGEEPIESRRYIEVENIELVSEGKPVVATVENPDYHAVYINDGDPNTRWHSRHNLAEHTQSVTIDLGEVCTIDEIYLHWEAAYASHYKIQVALEENGTYTDVYEAKPTTNGKLSIDTFLNGDDVVSGRYVRLLCLTPNSTVNMYSVWEFQVYKTGILAGDVDGDGEITIKDALLCIKGVVDNSYDVCADMNKDGKLSLIDVLRIMKVIAK